MDETTAQKECAKCGEVRPLAEFSRHSQAKTGLQPRCNVLLLAVDYLIAHGAPGILREAS